MIKSGSHVGNNEEVKEGDEWSMEVDLRSREKEKRTLHWFVRGIQQNVFITGVPDRVEFGVCFFISFFFFNTALFLPSYLFRSAPMVIMRV